MVTTVTPLALWALLVATGGNLVYSQAPAPSNDLCRGAIQVSVGKAAVAGSTTTATTEDDFNCGYYRVGVDNAAPGVWYTTLGTGRIFEASTCDGATNFATAIQIFSGTCQDLNTRCSSGVAGIAAEDATCSNALASRVKFDAVDGVRYLIFVFSRDKASSGNFKISLRDFVPPPNDFCQDATRLIVNGAPVSGNTANATQTGEGNFNCGYYRLGVDNKAPGVWYQVDGNNRRMSASTCASVSSTDLASAIQVFSGTCEALSNRCANGVAGSSVPDPACPLRSSRVDWDAVAGVKYFIFVFGRNPGGAGKFAITVKDFIPPANDLCPTAARLSLDGTKRLGTTVHATRIGESNFNCGYYRRGVDNEAPGVWYQVVGSGGNVTISTCTDETKLATAIQVFSGTCETLSNRCVNGITGNRSPNVACQNILSTEVKWKTTPGVLYFVYVFGRNAGETGAFGLRAVDSTVKPKPPTRKPTKRPSRKPTKLPTRRPT